MQLMFSRVLLSLLVAFIPRSFAELTHQEVDARSREGLELTVYNNDLTIIRDRREIVMPTGEVELEFKDVAMTIAPPTVSISSGASRGFVASQQNYRFDLLNRRSLLERFVGQKVKYSRSVLEGTQFEKVLREGILLSIEPEIVQFGDVIEVEPEGTISLPYLPEDLRTTPTLIFVGENNRSGEQVIEVQYHAHMIGWNADYSLAIDDRGRGRLNGWITIRNNSGNDYAVTKLQLVAGEANKLPAAVPVAEMARLSVAADAVSRIPSQTFGDYHVYDYPGHVHLLKNDMTQLRLIEAEGIRTEKTYRLESHVGRYQTEPTAEVPLSVWISFVNDEKNGLGEAIPAGTVRVYEDENDFVGEALITHSPVNKKVELQTGRAFDITAQRMQTSYRRLGERSIQVGNRITVNNAKPSAVEVLLHEKLSGDWEIVQESEKSEIVDAGTLAYTLKVPGRGSAAVDYLVQMKW